MKYDGTGSWALVTGASGGMGADFSRLLADRKFNLLLTARREKELETLKAELLERSPGIDIRVLAGNLSDRAFRDTLLEESAGLPVTVLINNAGVGAYGAFDEIPAAAEESLIDLDIKALVHLTRALSVRMKGLGKGFILETASIAAFQPCPLYATYGAAKSFVLNYGLAARAELAKTGVSVTVLCPGVTATGFFDAASQDTLSAFQKASMMPSMKVAGGALRALFSGKAVYVPGALNRINAFCTRFVSRTLAARMAGLMMR